MNGAAKPTPYVDQADTRIMMAALSPDNRHVALILGQPLQAQLFVQTFPDPTQGRWPVSGIGGSFPRWRPDGKELFFLQDGALHAVPVVAAARPVGEATKLFELPVVAAQSGLVPYDVTPDGQRFVVIRRRDAHAPRTITVILNWQPTR